MRQGDRMHGELRMVLLLFIAWHGLRGASHVGEGQQAQDHGDEEERGKVLLDARRAWSGTPPHHTQPIGLRLRKQLSDWLTDNLSSTTCDRLPATAGQGAKSGASTPRLGRCRSCGRLPAIAGQGAKTGAPTPRL